MEGCSKSAAYSLQILKYQIAAQEHRKLFPSLQFLLNPTSLQLWFSASIKDIIILLSVHLQRKLKYCQVKMSFSNPNARKKLQTLTDQTLRLSFHLQN